MYLQVVYIQYYKLINIMEFGNISFKLLCLELQAYHLTIINH